ncbi:MAG: hypothetical protein FJX52_03805 [Alphaproteobacteria bacterium]|nr:hypothetical protein [Alphaproteobacteria bacterium]
MPHYLSVCAIFKDEASYLEEWLIFYDLIGVDHFYLYNNNSGDKFMAVLKPWIDRRRVTLHDWPQHPGQLRAYGHCLDHHKRDTRWIMYVDIDEFFFSPLKQHLPEILERYERFAGVAANWMLFGSSGHHTRPIGPVTLAYTRRAGLQFRISEQGMLRPGGDSTKLRDYYPQCSHIKSIVDASRANRVYSPHSFGYCDGSLTVDETGEPITSAPLYAFTEEPRADILRVNHYFSKSLEEYRAKLSRPRADSGTIYPNDWALMREERCNTLVDETILPIAHQISARLTR